MTKARDLANGGFGLVLVKPSSVVGGTDNGKGTVSFSAASSVSLNDVFSATYKNYKIIFTGTGANDDLKLRLRVGGSDASGSDYWYLTAWMASNSASMQTPVVAENGTSLILGEIGSSSCLATFDVNSPFLATTTTMNIHNSFSRGTSTGNVRSYFGGGFQDLATSYTGFTIFPTSTTMTGSISVYGYNN